MFDVIQDLREIVVRGSRLCKFTFVSSWTFHRGLLSTWTVVRFSLVSLRTVAVVQRLHGLYPISAVSILDCDVFCSVT